MSRPRVSVIIPVFNGASFLRQAIESALAQSFPPDEVIVIDDGSTDDSLEVASSLPVLCIHQPHAGVSAARNAAIERANGDLLAFLDSDDVWVPQKLALQLNASISGAYVTCQVQTFSDGCPPAADYQPGQFVPSSWLVPKDVWLRVGPFREDLSLGEDIDWLARAKDLDVDTVVVPEVLVHKRLHDNNASARVESAGRIWLDTLRGSLARKRQAGRLA